MVRIEAQKFFELREGVSEIVVSRNVAFELVGRDGEDRFRLARQAHSSDAFGFGADPPVLLD